MALGDQELGRRIAQAREDARLSQPELAQRIGLRHPQSISNYERGKGEVPPGRLRRIAEATGKPLTFFVDEQSPPLAPGPHPLARQESVEELAGLVQAQFDELREFRREFLQAVVLLAQNVAPEAMPELERMLTEAAEK